VRCSTRFDTNIVHVYLQYMGLFGTWYHKKTLAYHVTSPSSTRIIIPSRANTISSASEKHHLWFKRWYMVLNSLYSNFLVTIWWKRRLTTLTYVWIFLSRNLAKFSMDFILFWETMWLNDVWCFTWVDINNVYVCLE
jgi:hypothetical protein